MQLHRKGWVIEQRSIALSSAIPQPSLFVIPPPSCLSFRSAAEESASALASEIGPGLSPDITATRNPGLQPPGHALRSLHHKTRVAHPLQLHRKGWVIEQRSIALPVVLSPFRPESRILVQLSLGVYARCPPKAHRDYPSRPKVVILHDVQNLCSCFGLGVHSLNRSHAALLLDTPDIMIKGGNTEI